MSITSATSLKNATAAVVAVTGRKFCRKCNSHKTLDGGRLALDSRRRTVWYCKGCTRMTSGQASPATTPETHTPVKARPTTPKRDVSAGLTDFWKQAHAPLKESHENT